MTTVACVLRSGGRYCPEWVAKLRDGVAAHMGAHRFVCLSDVGVPCERIPLLHGWPGWWSKCELLRPGIFEGPVLYLDLDCIVTGPLDDLVSDGPLTMCDDFLRPGLHNSSVMSWHGDYSHIYEAMRRDPECVMAAYTRRKDKRIGDQAFIEDQVTPETVPAGRIVSYRVSARHEVPEGASVVAFHGNPKPDSAGGWVRW